MEYMVYIIGIFGALAFVVNVIVEMIKDLPTMKKIPTKLVAIVVSVLVVYIALAGFTQLLGITVLPAYVILALPASFIVAFQAMNGFDALKEIYVRISSSEVNKIIEKESDK